MKKIGILINDLNFMNSHRNYLTKIINELNTDCEVREFSFGKLFNIFLWLLNCNYYWAISPKTSLILSMIPLSSKRKIITFSGFGTIGFMNKNLLKFIFHVVRVFNPNISVTTQNNNDTVFFKDIGFKKVINLGGNGIVENNYLSKVTNTDIIFVGRLLNQKGISDFVNMKKIIDNQIPENNYEWKVYGLIDKKNPSSWTSDQIELAKTKGIIFCGFESNILQKMANGKLLIFPSYREGLPKTIIEALSVGLPTVGYDVPGVQDILSFNRDILLENKPKNYYGLADKSVKILTNQKLWSKLNLQGRTNFTANFRKEITIEKNRDFLKSILN